MVSHPGTSVPDTSSAHFRLPGFAYARELRHGSLMLLAHKSIGRLSCYRGIIDFLLLRLVINVTDGQAAAHAGSHSIGDDEG